MGSAGSHAPIREFTRQEALKLIHEKPEQAADLLVALNNTVIVLMGRVEELNGTVVELRGKVVELEQRLAKNSSNSSKPPSSDGYGKPNPKSLRTKTGKKSGGQTGHSGDTLTQVDVPDERVPHGPATCSCGLQICQGTLVNEVRRQVFDILAPRMRVVEHYVQTVACACGKVHVGQFPDGINAPVQYGPNIKAIASYLNQYQFLPYERTCEALADLLGCHISPGTLRNILAECHAHLENTEAMIKDHISAAAVAQYDETGMRIEGKTNWIHSASTSHATHYHAHERRGSDAANDAGILPRFKGKAIHDGWKAYMRFDCEHGLCNAHHLRELRFVEEECHQPWARDMAGLLLDIKAAVASARAAGHGQLDEVIHTRFIARYADIIAAAYVANPWQEPDDPAKRGRKKKTKALNLVERLDKQRDAVLLFMNDFMVPFDNNLAERDIRMVKLHQKISGSFRSRTGAEIFCRTRSYLSTARKNGVGALQALQLAFKSTPFAIP
jgi:transposase